jgi:hypothetical protein
VGVLTPALADRARVIRTYRTRERIEGRSASFPMEGQWFPCRLVVQPAREVEDPEHGRRRIVETGELVAATDDVRVTDEVEVRSHARRDTLEGRGQPAGRAHAQGRRCRRRARGAPGRAARAGGHVVNALRSINRYVAQALGDDFEVRFAVDEANFERPFARVKESTPMTSTPHGARHRDLRQTFSIVAFPLEGLNAESSLVQAKRVETLLLDAFTGRGLDTASYRNGRGHPHRIPLYDYSGLGLREAATDGERVGYLRVIEPLSMSTFSDPADDRLYIVACNLRCGWSEYVGVPIDAPSVERVTVSEGS